MAEGEDGSPVPSGRWRRLGKVAKMAASIGAGAALEGSRYLARRERPDRQSLLLTSRNAQVLTKELRSMRGAALKLGQMLSLDAGDFIPAELTAILASLREDASAMPAAQLEAVLVEQYGEDWQLALYHFDFTPLAAASIGQVHRAITQQGDDIVLKIQYPGVRESIDSDVDNMSALLKLSGLLPPQLDIQPLLAMTREQLHDETDYLREAQMIVRYRSLLAQHPAFIMPDVLEALSSTGVLAMSYCEGEPLEALFEASQAERDRAMQALFALMFDELFSQRFMQTDPNFANYRYRPASDQGDAVIVLLDFGACRDIDASIVESYRQLLLGLLRDDDAHIEAAAARLRFINPESPAAIKQQALALLKDSVAPMFAQGDYDFGTEALPFDIDDMQAQYQQMQPYWLAPLPESLFVQRKLGGMFLLARQLKARVPMRELITDHLPVQA